MAIIYPAFIWLVGLFFALVLLVFPGSSKGQTYNNRETFNQTYPLNQNGRVSISNINGEIIVDTWERNEVKVEAVKIFEDCDRQMQIDIRVDARADYVKIETDFGNQSWSGRNWNRCKKSEVDYKLTVPRNARLEEVESVNGQIRISGAKGFVKATTVNGELTAQNLGNSAELSTVNGTLEATFERVENNGNLKLDAVNGTVRLSVPSDVDAMFKADTVNGNITNDFGLPVKKGEYVGRNLFGRLGDGTASIKLSTVNGTIEIKRNSDGKSPKKVENLLEAKNVRMSGEPTFSQRVDDDTRRSVEIAQRTMERSKRDQERAMRNQQRDLANAQRELKNIKLPPMPPNAIAVAGIPPMPPGFDSDLVLTERVTDSFPLKNSQRLNIEAPDSRVTVRGWDKAEVSYNLVKQAGSESDLKQIKAQTTNEGNDLTLRIVSSNDAREWDNSGETELEVFVPRNVSVRIHNSDGDALVENVSGTIEIEGSDGDIDVRDSSGTLKVRTSDGRVRVIGFNGSVDAHSSDGTLNLEGDFSALSAGTSDGSIVLTLKDDANATIETNAEEIGGDFAAKIGDTNQWKIGNGGTKFKLSTGDGEIIVRRQSAITVQPQ